MTKSLALFVLCAFAGGPLTAQAPKAAAEARPVTVTSVTITLRSPGSNIPLKFTSFIMRNGSVTLPLHPPSETGWVAQVRIHSGDAKTPPTFDLNISDTSRMRSYSSEHTPFYQRPTEILDVTLPHKTGEDTKVYKSHDLTISILFETVTE